VQGYHQVKLKEFVNALDPEHHLFRPVLYLGLSSVWSALIHPKGTPGAMFAQHVDLHGFCSVQVVYNLRESEEGEVAKYWFGVLPTDLLKYREVIKKLVFLVFVLATEASL
jgi:hypothetical protein